MARPRNTGGTVYPRKESAFWWVCYRARDGRKIKESSETADREEAERFLRERLAARDEGRLPAILSSKSLTFSDLGGMVFGKALQAAVPVAQHSSAKRERA